MPPAMKIHAPFIAGGAQKTGNEEQDAARIFFLLKLSIF
jgi:hypothetical protein